MIAIIKFGDFEHVQNDELFLLRILLTSPGYMLYIQPFWLIGFIDLIGLYTCDLWCTLLIEFYGTSLEQSVNMYCLALFAIAILIYLTILVIVICLFCHLFYNQSITRACFRYLDKYRDQKEIAEEVLKEHLREITPFKSLEDQQLAFPLATPTKPGVYEDDLPPTWLQKVHRHKINKTGKYKFIHSEGWALDLLTCVFSD